MRECPPMRVSLVIGVVLALALAPALALPQQTEIASIEEGAHAEIVREGLAMPVDIAFGPDGALYYASFESGRLVRVNADGSNETIWTAPNLQLGGERGFVGLGIPPDSDGNTFYVYYQTNKSGSVVSRLSRIVDGQESVLIDDIKSEKLHNSGRIAFGPDGLMYLSIGDAVIDTVGRAKSMHAHDPNVLNGKVLRLNLDGTAAAGNPWGNEVWTKGHRNVYGLAVSPGNVLLGTENGPESWDEVNLLVGGKDYGWPTCSGACNDTQYTNPLFAYESTIAPTGAVWYDGHFYFSDFNKGSVHRVRLDESGAFHDEKVLKFTTPRILDIAVGSDGLYVSTWDSVWKLTPAQKPSGWSLPTPMTPTGPPTTQIVPDEPGGPAATPPPTESNDPAAIGRGSRETPSIGVFAYALVALAALVRGRRS